jgi:DNA-binding NarL/FixJ family response regulator
MDIDDIRGKTVESVKVSRHIAYGTDMSLTLKFTDGTSLYVSQGCGQYSGLDISPREALEKPAKKRLSKMERGVLSMMAEGKKHTEIAEVLDATVAAVDNALCRARKKLGVK